MCVTRVRVCVTREQGNLTNFETLGNLRQLVTLDLYNNNMTGDVRRLALEPSVWLVWVLSGRLVLEPRGVGLWVLSGHRALENPACGCSLVAPHSTHPFRRLARCAL